MRGEESAHRGPHAHPEVDRQPVEGEGLAPQLGRGEVADQGQRRGAHRLGDGREDRHPGDDLRQRPEQGKAHIASPPRRREVLMMRWWPTRSASRPAMGEMTRDTAP